MKIAITGASGFIGGHLVRSLSCNHQILALSRRAIPVTANTKHRVTDITKAFSLPMGIDILIHSAATTNLDDGIDECRNINTNGTKQVVEAAKKANVKHILYISSTSVYDVMSDKLRVSEQAPKASKHNNPYSITKLEGEEIIKQSGLKYTILRPHIVYGPVDTSILTELLKKIRSNKLTLPLKNEKELSVTHVGNVVSVVSQIISRPPRTSKIYNIADTTYQTNLKMIKELIGLFPEVRIRQINPWVVSLFAKLTLKKVISEDMVRQLNQHSSVSCELLLSDGYNLPYTLDDGVNDIKEWIDSFQNRQSLVSDSTVWPHYEHSRVYS